MLGQSCLGGLNSLYIIYKWISVAARTVVYVFIANAYNYGYILPEIMAKCIP